MVQILQSSWSWAQVLLRPCFLPGTCCNLQTHHHQYLRLHLSLSTFQYLRCFFHWAHIYKVDSHQYKTVSFYSNTQTCKLLYVEPLMTRLHLQLLNDIFLLKLLWFCLPCWRTHNYSLGCLFVALVTHIVCNTTDNIFMFFLCLETLGVWCGEKSCWVRRTTPRAPALVIIYKTRETKTN